MVLDPKLQKFTTTSQSVTSYSYTDIADGTGVQTFYAAGTLSPTADHILTTKVVTSADNTSTQNSTGTLEVDFDLTAFNLPRDVKGTAIFQGNLTASTSGGGYATLGAQIFKWDGTTETAVTSEITSQQEDNATIKILLSLPITNTHFATGDVLRLKLSLTNSNGAVINCSFNHDPSGVTPTILYVPFEVAV